MKDNAAPNLVPAALEFPTTVTPDPHPDETEANRQSLLQGTLIAKPISGLDPVLQRMVDAVTALGPRHACLKSALRQYLFTDRPLTEIAREHSYTGMALVYWIRKLGLPQGRHERPVLLAPTEQHRRVIALVREHGIAEAARRAEVTKPRILQIVRRWAPELEGCFRKTEIRPRPKRRQPRSIIVSFRISEGDWQRLLAAKPTADEPGMSGCEKARAIVLNFLGPSEGDGGDSIQTAPISGGDQQNTENVNVYKQQAA